MFLDSEYPSCYVVAQGNGAIELLDCREPRRSPPPSWVLEHSKKRTIGCMTLGKAHELIFTYKNLNTLNVVDMRKTTYSPITGKQSPTFLSSVDLSVPTPLSLYYPFFTKVSQCLLSQSAMMCNE